MKTKTQQGHKGNSRNQNQYYENIVFQIPNRLWNGWTDPPILYLPWRSAKLKDVGMETLA